MRQLVFVLSKIYLYSTFYINIQQYAFSFSLNPNYFHSTKIFVQLQPKIISFNKNNYSTSTKNNFIQQQSSRTFKISSFNKIPRPSPVKYKTTLSHVSNKSKTQSNGSPQNADHADCRPCRLSTFFLVLVFLYLLLDLLAPIFFGSGHKLVFDHIIVNYD